MSKPQPALAESTAAIEPTQPKTVTNWTAFIKANVSPTTIYCQDYKPAQRVDTSCHSRIQLKAPAIIRHMAPEHDTGGGFQFVLKHDSKEWPGWSELADAGVEIHDIRCENCDHTIPLNPRNILQHLKPHSGKTRGVRDIKTLNLTLRFSVPDSDDDSEDNES